MTLPGNGIFVVRGEMSTLMMAMRRGARWSHHQDDDDPLTKSFQELKELLNRANDLNVAEPQVYLGPFLEVIRSGETTCTVTSLALLAVNKFLSYGLLDRTQGNVAAVVHNIANAATHVRFVSADHTSDGIVLMRVLQLLRTLTLAPEGALLTNESLCEIMISCFRISFETRLNELLRRTAEHYLKDMMQLVFTRLPQFSNDLRAIKQLKMKPGTIEHPRGKRRKSFRLTKEDAQSPTGTLKQVQPAHLSTTPQTPTIGGSIVDIQGAISSQNTPPTGTESPCGDGNPQINVEAPSPEVGEEVVKGEDVGESLVDSEDYVNQRGIRFVPQVQQEESAVLIPYGLASVRELFRFLISLCNPHDKENTDIMIHLGLTLLTVALEVGADHIGKHGVLLGLVKDELCRNLFALLQSERLSVFAADLQVCFLMFECLRHHLKFQLELYLTKLSEIIMSDSQKVQYEHKELALDNILQLWRIPGFVSELYLNYDCNMYCTNLFEDLSKLLAKNSFNATSNGVYHTHLLSLDALLTVVEHIEQHCADKGIVARDSGIKSTENVPSRDDLIACKNIKKWLPSGSEHFNTKPSNGIQFFQEHGVLKSELDPHEIALFLRENTLLDKRMIGEYLSNRKNVAILDAYVKTFDFSGIRIDEALRQFLENFRLPGEEPLVSHMLEYFAQIWHTTNGEPFANTDAAFVLAYAIIILNVDQHNVNARKQSVSMSLNAFKRNLRGTNGDQDFDQDMLDRIYNAIRSEEIVMPAERSGAVLENYIWKVLQRRGASKDGVYYNVAGNEYDREILATLWSPLMAALSFMFDKTDDAGVCSRTLGGFRRCASISSFYQESSNLDGVIQTLSKFTTLYHNQQAKSAPSVTPGNQFSNNNNNNNNNSNVVVTFGANTKARLALKLLVDICHQFGDNVREGWTTLFHIVLTLYTQNLLPKSYVEAEDFIEPRGRIALTYREVANLQKPDAGLFSSLYSYMVSSDMSKVPTAEEQQLIDLSNETVRECSLEQIVSDSKFLHDESLVELVRALVDLSRGPDVQKSLGYTYNESVAVFFLELLIKIVIQNRDRVMAIWQQVRDHIYTLMMNSSLFDYQFLLERSVIGLLRIAIRLMRNEDMSPVVLQSLQMLLLLRQATLCRISRQISYGLYELLKTSAQNIHTRDDWTIVFTLLECVGAGAQPPRPRADDSRSDGDDDSSVVANNDRGYTSDSELTNRHSPSVRSPSAGWILIGSEGEVQPVIGRTIPAAQYNLSLERNLGGHDPSSLIKCCESLAFLVRDVAHITPYNFDDCVHCIRTFVEASLHGSKRVGGVKKPSGKSNRRRVPRRRGSDRRSATSSPDEMSGGDEDEEEEDLPSGYHQISIQLLDLMHTLHTRTAQIFKWWAEEGGSVTVETSLWTQGWCPLLQGIARLCCDVRREVRTYAISYLQRALLVHDLQTLTPPEWEQCFHRVLFPLLGHLLDPIDPPAMEETRSRAHAVLSKVFLHHLTPLLSLPTFTSLWLVILDLTDKYMHADKSDLLYEAIPESLKNMLLVMDSARVFDGPEGGGKNALWVTTWERIHRFLPNMREDLFKEIGQQPEDPTTTNDPKTEIATAQQHNVENATRSIILQPPSSQQVSSHLFAHLGQMVSTPIVPPPYIQTSQPTLQPGMPYLYSTGQTSTNMFSYTPAVVGAPTEVQPQSLYSEYVGNPYNGSSNDKETGNLSNYFSSEVDDFLITGGDNFPGGDCSNNTIPVCTDGNK